MVGQVAVWEEAAGEVEEMATLSVYESVGTDYVNKERFGIVDQPEGRSFIVVFIHARLLALEVECRRGIIAESRFEVDGYFLTVSFSRIFAV